MRWSLFKLAEQENGVKYETKTVINSQGLSMG